MYINEIISTLHLKYVGVHQESSKCALKGKKCETFWNYEVKVCELTLTVINTFLVVARELFV